MRKPIIALLLLAAVACEDAVTPSTPTTTPPTSPTRPNGKRARPDAPSQFDMVRTVPGFGGFDINPVAGPKVYLT